MTFNSIVDFFFYGSLVKKYTYRVRTILIMWSEGVVNDINLITDFNILNILKTFANANK